MKIKFILEFENGKEYGLQAEVKQDTSYSMAGRVVRQLVRNLVWTLQLANRLDDNAVHEVLYIQCNPPKPTPPEVLADARRRQNFPMEWVNP